MQKNYAEQLGQWVKQRPSTKRDRNVVAFLAVRDDAQTALAAGHAARTVWMNMREAKRIDFCYDTFLIYVKRYIRAPGPTPDKVQPSSIQKARSTPSKRPTAPVPPASEAAPGFTFNPTPRKEDLL